MGSHSVTFYPTQVNAPRLHPSQSGRYSIYLPQRDRRLSWYRVMFRIFKIGSGDNINYVLYYTGILPLSYHNDLIENFDFITLNI